MSIWGKIEILKVDDAQFTNIYEHSEYATRTDNGLTISYEADDLHDNWERFGKNLRRNKVLYSKEYGAEWGSSGGREKHILLESGEFFNYQSSEDAFGKTNIGKIELAYQNKDWNAIADIIAKEKLAIDLVDWESQLVIRDALKHNPAYGIFFNNPFKISDYNDINQKDSYGNTALINIIINGLGFNKELINICDINIQDNEGKTALMHSSRNPKHFEKLLDANADTWIKDNEGKTVDDYVSDKMKSLLDKKRLEKEVDQDDNFSLSL